jgi:hypothetical protein
MRMRALLLAVLALAAVGLAHALPAPSSPVLFADPAARAVVQAAGAVPASADACTTAAPAQLACDGAVGAVLGPQRGGVGAYIYPDVLALASVDGGTFDLVEDHGAGGQSLVRCAVAPASVGALNADVPLGAPAQFTFTCTYVQTARDVTQPWTLHGRQDASILGVITYAVAHPG